MKNKKVVKTYKNGRHFEIWGAWSKIFSENVYSCRLKVYTKFHKNISKGFWVNDYFQKNTKWRLAAKRRIFRHMLIGHFWLVLTQQTRPRSFGREFRNTLYRIMYYWLISHYWDSEKLFCIKPIPKTLVQSKMTAVKSQSSP